MHNVPLLIFIFFCKIVSNLFNDSLVTQKKEEEEDKEEIMLVICFAIQIVNLYDFCFVFKRLEKNNFFFIKTKSRYLCFDDSVFVL